MIHAENQVRNFYVFNKGYEASTSIDAKPEWCAKGLITADRNKFGIQFKDANGKKLTSDLVDRKKIKEIRVSVPYGFQGLKYSLSQICPSASNGDVIVYDFDFTNVFGFSDKEHYHRTFSVLYDTNASTTANKLYQMLEAGKDAHADNIFWSAFDLENNSGTYTLKDAKQEYDAIRGFYPHDIKVLISAHKDGAAATSSTTLDAWNINRFDSTNWSSGISADTNNVLTNYYKIADLQYAQSKVRADMYGYNGYPDINPTTLNTVDPTKTYVVCDIKYSRNLAGINVQDSDKELSFAMEYDASDSTNYGRLDDVLAIVNAVSTATTATVGAALDRSNSGVGFYTLTLI